MYVIFRAQVVFSSDDDSDSGSHSAFFKVSLQPTPQRSKDNSSRDSMTILFSPLSPPPLIQHADHRASSMRTINVLDIESGNKEILATESRTLLCTLMSFFLVNSVSRLIVVHIAKILLIIRSHVSKIRILDYMHGKLGTNKTE